LIRVQSGIVRIFRERGSQSGRITRSKASALERTVVTVTLVSADPDILFGDINRDGVTDFLDIGPFY